MRISCVYLGNTRPLSEASTTGGASFTDKLVKLELRLLLLAAAITPSSFQGERPLIRNNGLSHNDAGNGRGTYHFEKPRSSATRNG